MIRVFGALVLALSVLLLPHAAPAAPGALTATIGNHFTPGDTDPFPVRAATQRIDTVVLPLVIRAGEDLIHINRDIEGHNLTAVDLGEDGRPLFEGETIDRSQVSMVETSHLAPGSYDFICTIHSEFMEGTLTVT